jgi:Ligated ion channel L-glutamate- and glycine-binding site
MRCKISYVGYITAVYSYISQAINFNVNVVHIGDEGALYDDGKAEGPFKLLINNQTDLIVADYWLMPTRLKFIDSSLPYIVQQIAFIIPPGASFSSFEKLILPFDLITWIILIILFTISLIVIFGIQRAREKNDRIYGDPYMNFIAAIFGGSQRKLPQHNFHRIVLMTLVIFCLVMRTLYQASLYNFLQSNIQHKEAQSVDDMIERDYKFYYLSSVKDLFLETPVKIRDR